MTDQLPDAGCPTCATYAETRGPRILEEIRKTSTDPADVLARWTRFLVGYHGRHAVSPDRLRIAGRFVALMAVAQELEEEVEE